MANKKEKKNKYFFENKREIELPTLIDMVFLLLIFFISTLSLSSSGDQDLPTPSRKSFTLPRARGETSVLTDEILSTLLIQVTHVNDNPASPKVVYILQPDEQNKLTEVQALKKVKEEISRSSPDSSHYGIVPENAFEMPGAVRDTTHVFSIIRQNIQEYTEEHLHTPSISNTIEVRAAQDTEFGIINYIMEQCSQYGNLIPKITFRVLSSEKESLVNQEEEESQGGV